MRKDDSEIFERDVERKIVTTTSVCVLWHILNDLWKPSFHPELWNTINSDKWRFEKNFERLFKKIPSEFSRPKISPENSRKNIDPEFSSEKQIQGKSEAKENENKSENRSTLVQKFRRY